MNDEPLYNEAWWERELHRNEKLMDRYLVVLADNPDLARLQQPDGGRGANQPGTHDPTDDGMPPGSDAIDGENTQEAMLESPIIEEMGGELADDIENGMEDCPPDNAGYAEVARLARRFAVALGSLEPRDEIPEILSLSAPKIGANLAGGHGLGYDEETLCGNIVKCRWALADCEFCREMLEQLAQKSGCVTYRSLAAQSGRLSGHIRERIVWLLARVWW